MLHRLLTVVALVSGQAELDVTELRRTAEQGNAAAQNSLGLMYGNGRGVPQDDIAAHMWANLAAAQGNENARRLRDLLAEGMSSGQIAAAKRAAREWRPAFQSR